MVLVFCVSLDRNFLCVCRSSNMAQLPIPLFRTPHGAFAHGVHRNSFGRPQPGGHGNVFYPINRVFTHAFIAAQLAQRYIHRVPRNLRLPSHDLCYDFGMNGWCSLTSYINRGIIPWPYLPLKEEEKDQIEGSEEEPQQHVCTCPVEQIERSTLCCKKDTSEARNQFWNFWRDICLKVKTKKSKCEVLNNLKALDKELQEKVRLPNINLRVLVSHTLNNRYKNVTAQVVSLLQRFEKDLWKFSGHIRRKQM